jgi:hypothetical protein
MSSGPVKLYFTSKKMNGAKIFGNCSGEKIDSTHNLNIWPIHWRLSVILGQ